MLSRLKHVAILHVNCTSLVKQLFWAECLFLMWQHLMVYTYSGSLQLAVFSSWDFLGGQLGFFSCWYLRVTGSFLWAPGNFFKVLFRKHPIYLAISSISSCDLWIEILFLYWGFVAAYQELPICIKKKLRIELPRWNGKCSGLLAAIRNISEWHEAFIWSGSSFKAVFIIMILVPSDLTTVKYRHQRAAPGMYRRLKFCQWNKQFPWKLKLVKNLIELGNGLWLSKENANKDKSCHLPLFLCRW